MSNAEFKSFPTLELAKAYLNGDDPTGEEVWLKKSLESGDTCFAFVDGSYDEKSGDFSSGGVIFYRGEKREFSKRYGDRQELGKMRNVAGEIMASVLTIRWCLKEGVPIAEIHHDYEGVARWAMGSWKANLPGTKAYADFCENARKKMTLRFVKVQAHSGDPLNERADALAKAALAEPE